MLPLMRPPAIPLGILLSMAGKLRMRGRRRLLFQ